MEERVRRSLGQVTKAVRIGGGQLRSSDLQSKLDQDLFHLSAGDRRQSRLNAIEQLNLLKLICAFYLEKSNEGRQRYSYFEVIFCGREGESVLHDHRVQLLIRLCSLAVQFPCHALLIDTSIWLNKISGNKSYGQQIASTIVAHYTDSVYDNSDSLHCLSTSAIEFVPHLMVHGIDDQSPNHRLNRVIGFWLHDNARGILQALVAAPHLSKLFAVKIFPYLLRQDLSTLNNKTSNIDKARLHSALLHTMILWRELGSPSLDCSQTLIESASDADAELFAQALQMAISTRCCSSMAMERTMANSMNQFKQLDHGQLQCLVCSESVSSKLWTAHANSRKHLRRLQVEHVETKSSTSTSQVILQGSSKMDSREAADVLPVGFFDDPKRNNQLREVVEKKERLDVEFDRFLKEVDKAVADQREADDEAAEEDWVARELEGIDEQIDEWRRVNELEKRRDALRPQKSSIPASRIAVEEESTEERDLDMDNWRMKAI